MKSSRPDYNPARTFMFIMIGAALIIVVDLFVLDGKSVIWRASKNVSASASSVESIEELQQKHQSYMQRGIIPAYSSRNPSRAIEQANLDQEVAPFIPIPRFEVPEDIKLPKSLPVEPVQNFTQTLGSNDRGSVLQAIEPANGQLSSAPAQAMPPAYPADVIRAPIENKSEGADHPPPIKKINVTPQGKNGKIVIIIDDMGLTLRSRQVEVMQTPLTLSYLPYAENLRERTKIARQNGHEIMVHIPMEAMGGNDGGPQVLEVSDSAEEIDKTVSWGLSQFDGFVGLNNHMGSRFTQDAASVEKLMQSLEGRGLYFIDSKTISTSIAEKVAAEHGLRHASRDVFIDHEISRTFIVKALKQLEAIAHQRGFAIAIGHPHKETIEALKDWLPTLPEKGLELVPASAVVREPTEDHSPDLLLVSQKEKPLEHEVYPETTPEIFNEIQPSGR